MLSSRNHTTPVKPVFSAILSPLIIVIVFTGCAVGPEFVKPQIPINQKWSATDSSAFVSRTAPDSNWWTVFNDSVLNRLIGFAYHQNISLQITGLRIMEARAQLAIATGRQFPQNQAVIGNLSAIGVSENIADAVGINRNFLNYQLGLDVSWEADLWGKYRYNVKTQKNSLLATVADYDNALVSLTAEVARTYTTIRTYEILIEQAQRNAQLQGDGLRIAESRFRNGATSELDVVMATTLLENTRASIPQLEKNLILYQNALCTLLGQPTSTVQKLLQESKGIPIAPQEVSLTVPAELLLRRPDIRYAELEAIAQCSRIGIAKSELYPQIKISGIISTQSSSGSGVPASDIFDPGSFMYIAGPQLTWPFLNYGQISNNVRVEDARFQQLILNYKNTVLKAAQEVEDGLTGYLKSKEAAVFAQNAVNGAQRSVDLSLIQYREGAVDYERVLDAQRSLLQEQNSLTQLHSAIVINLISLYRALGGGWELREGQPFVSDSTRIEMQRRTNWGNLFSKPIVQENEGPGNYP